MHCTCGRCPKNETAGSAQTYIVETESEEIIPPIVPASSYALPMDVSSSNSSDTATAAVAAAASPSSLACLEDPRDPLFEIYVPCLQTPEDCSKVLSQTFGDKLGALISRHTGGDSSGSTTKIRLVGTPVRLGSPRFSVQLARQLEHLNLCRDCEWFFKVSVPKHLATAATKEQSSRRLKTEEYIVSSARPGNVIRKADGPSVYTFQFAWIQPLGTAIARYSNVLKSFRTTAETFAGVDIQLQMRETLSHDDEVMDESLCCTTFSEMKTKEAETRYLRTLHDLLQRRLDSELQLQMGEWVEKRNAMAMVAGSSFLPCCSNISMTGCTSRFFIGGFDFPNDMYGLAYANVKLSENIKNSFQVNDRTIDINVKHVRYLSLADLTTSLHGFNLYLCNNYNAVMSNHALIHRHRKRCALTHTGCLIVDTTRHQSLDMHQMEFVTLPSVNGCHVFKCDKRIVSGESFDMDIAAMPLELLPLSLLVLSEAVLVNNKGDRKYFYVMSVKRMQNSVEETHHYFLDTTKSVDLHDVKAVYATEAFDLFYAKMIASQ